MAISYNHIDSFANELFQGNPAGVCLVPAFPAAEVMQKIAAENRHSETAFVVSRADGDFDLRWFTPIMEDDLCGHATLASAYALWAVTLLIITAVVGIPTRLYLLAGVAFKAPSL